MQYWSANSDPGHLSSFSLYTAMTLSIFTCTMLQHHKGKVPHSVSKQLTSCVLDAELDWLEDFELKKDFEPITMDHS